LQDTHFGYSLTVKELQNPPITFAKNEINAMKLVLVVCPGVIKLKTFTNT